MQIETVAPDHPEVLALVTALDAYQAPMYPEESNHLLPPTSISHGITLLAQDTNQPLNTGCVSAIPLWASVSENISKNTPKTAPHWELKRMYVSETARGSGMARQLLQHLLQVATQRGARRILLETGIRQPAAIAFYRRQGFRQRDPFATYQPDSHSIFMEYLMGRGTIYSSA